MRRNKTCRRLANEGAPSIKTKDTVGMPAEIVPRNAHRGAELVDRAADLLH